MIDIYTNLFIFQAHAYAYFLTLGITAKEKRFRKMLHEYQKKYRVSYKKAYKKISYKLYHKKREKHVPIVESLMRELRLR
ncbi:MAG: hypothetical protein QXI16_00220 [Sulfolobaceae archaeon]